MSRQIDPNAPLSDADREWLMSNGQEMRVADHDSRLGVAYVPPAYVTGAEPSLATGSVAAGVASAPGVSPQQFGMVMGSAEQFLASLTDEQLHSELARREAAAEEGDDETEAAGSSLAATEVVREGEDHDGTTIPSYDNWKADTLRAQLGVRELSKSGTKTAMIARLREDDEDESDEDDS